MAENITISSVEKQIISATILPDEEDCFESPTLETIQSKTGQTFLFLLYTATSLFTLIGNLIVIIVQLYGKESSKSIQKYLLNLAISDIITGVFSVPFTYTSVVFGHWAYPHWLCPTAQYVQLLSVFITSFTISVIGAERYIVAIHPVSYLCTWFQSHNHLLLLCSWFFGSLYAYIPIANTYTTAFEVNGITYYQCNYDNEISQLKRNIFTLTNFAVTFLIPLLIMSFSYVAIMKRLKNSEKYISVYTATSRTKSSSETSKQNKEDTEGSVEIKSKLNQPQANNVVLLRKSPVNLHRSKIIRMMFIVVLAYCISWLPIKTLQFLLNLRIISHCSEETFYLLIYVYIFFHWLAMANSFVNPLLYSFLSKSFRNDFNKIVQTCRQVIRFERKDDHFPNVRPFKMAVIPAE